MTRRTDHPATPKTARLFTQGGSQAVRLPADFRFAGESVFVRRDKVTGDVVLSARPAAAYADFMALRTTLQASEGGDG